MNRYSMAVKSKLILYLVVISTTLAVGAQSLQGWYAFAGLSEWTEFTSPPSFLDGSDVLGDDGLQFKLGGGFSFSDKWSVEAAFTKFDERWLVGAVPKSRDYLNVIEDSIQLTLSPVLDVALTNNTSAIFKAGASWLSQDSKLYTLKPEIGRISTKESSNHTNLFGSMGLAFQIQPLKTTLEVSMTQYFDAPEGFSRSIDLHMRVHFSSFRKSARSK